MKLSFMMDTNLIWMKLKKLQWKTLLSWVVVRQYVLCTEVDKIIFWW